MTGREYMIAEQLRYDAHCKSTDPVAYAAFNAYAASRRGYGKRK